jgi:C4-dicarboxylate transporter, DctQ subunit
MRKLLRWGISVENLILIATFILMTLSVVVQVLNRNLLHLSMPWLEEIGLYSMIYLVMFGVEAGLRDGSQIRVTALRDVLPELPRRVLELTVKIIIALFSYAMAYYSASSVWTQIETGQSTPVLHMGMWVPYAAFPIVFLIVAIVHTVGAIALMRGHGEQGPNEAGPDSSERGVSS